MDKIIKTEKFTFDTLKNTYTNFITKEEINYYLKNGIFPWNPYVTNLITISIKNSISNSTNNETKNSNPDDILKDTMQRAPNRYAYSQYILSPDMTESIVGEAYLIYTGEKPLSSQASK